MRLLFLFLFLLHGVARGYPERVDDLMNAGDTRSPGSFASIISLMATEEDAPPEQQPHRVEAMGLTREQLQQHEGGSVGSRQRPHELGAASSSESPSALRRIAGHLAKRTVVLSTNTVESFSKGGIPAIWLSVLLVLAVVMTFLCCWCATPTVPRSATDSLLPCPLL